MIMVLRHLGHARCMVLDHLSMSTAVLVSHVHLQSTMYEHSGLIYSNLVSSLDNSSSYNSSSFSVFCKEANLRFNSSIAFLEDYVRYLKTKTYLNQVFKSSAIPLATPALAV